MVKDGSSANQRCGSCGELSDHNADMDETSWPPMASHKTLGHLVSKSPHSVLFEASPVPFYCVISTVNGTLGGASKKWVQILRASPVLRHLKTHRPRWSTGNIHLLHYRRLAALPL